MRKLIIAASLATGSITGQAMATEVHITATNPVIDLSVTDYVDATPDVASFSTGVQTLAPTANEAVRQNNAQMTAVVARLKKLGIADKDVQTTQISLNQQFDYSEGRQVFRGFSASNTVSAKLRDLKKLPQFLDALASDGATNFNGPMFSVDDDSKLKEAARDKAWDNAVKRANAIARKAGYANVRVLRVEEQSGEFGYPVPMVEMRAADAAGKATPIAPGQVRIGATMNFTFEMVK
ncbi:MAG TPA: SIMPL domain-containing protein [Sphingorhabdus sp.]|nr:SIMPL domain-containing protein [Sphingorhabdus sp.]